MSLRLFVYYCAVSGGCAAWLGWGLGRILGLEHPLMSTSLKGLALGMTVAAALGIVDALWNTSSTFGSMAPRVGLALLAGCFGGFLGALVGQALYGSTEYRFFVLFGWVLTGALVGAAPSLFDYVQSRLNNEKSAGPRRKVLRGLLGGAVGGLLGSLLYLLLGSVLGTVFENKSGTAWSPSATGFVALGLCIGLLIGLAQVILREGTIRVEEGFRPGRELMLSKEKISIGRSEACDLGLYGDAGVEKVHAYLTREGDRYYLVDAGTPGGTFINGQRIQTSTELKTGDEIRLGKRHVLRFGERQKHEAHT